MHFGISTHLFHGQRLQREHLAKIAGYGFDSVELFATRSHFDYHDPAAIDTLKGWLRETGLRLHSVHAPITDFVHGTTWSTTAYSTAATDADRRRTAVREAEAVLKMAERLPFEVMVVHLGMPKPMGGPADNSRNAAIKSAEELVALAAPTGVRVAFEVIPNDLSTAPALVRLVDELDVPHAGICMDFGHAHLMGDAAEAVEITGEHLIATHVHDNRGRDDEHLPPYMGTIDWDSVLLTMRKIGYEGTWLMELADTGSPAAVLEEGRRARQRFERTLTHV